MPTPCRLFVVCPVLLALTLAAGAQPPQPANAPVDPEPHLAFQLGFNMRFGLKVLKDSAGKPINKRLTFSPDGATNSTVVRIDGKDLEFGSLGGKWIEKATKFPNGVRTVWEVQGVRISQILEIVPSAQPVEVPGGVRKRLLDTCLIRYTIENHDTHQHVVGLRIQVDTLIGRNDGVPFTVPTLRGLVNTFKDFRTPQEVPEFVQALEVPDLVRPGTVGHMTLKVGGNIEPPSRVSLTHWPGFNFLKWEVPVVHMGTDSGVVLYWNDARVLQPGQQRNLGFAYGLGRVASGEGTGKLALTVSGSFLAGEPFSVTAYVKGPVPRQTLTLDLPEGLACVEGKHTEIVAPPAAGSRDTSVLTWKIKAPRAGQYAIKVRSSTGIAQTQPVSIREHAVASGGHLAGLTVTGPLVQGQVLTVTATVNSPLPGQHLTLTLPTGLERTEGELRQTVPALPAGRTHGECAVAWKVKAQQAGKFALAVKSSSGGTVSKHIAIALAKQAELTILDARRALQMSVGNLPENLILDMDRDGHVTSMDAAIILQRVLDRTRKGK